MPTVHHHVPTRVILTRAYTHFSYSLPCYPILHTTLLMHSHYSYCSSHPSPLPIPLTPYTYPSISFSLYAFHTHAHASILHIHIILHSRLMLSMHFDFSLVYITPYPSSHAYIHPHIRLSLITSSHPFHHAHKPIFSLYPFIHLTIIPPSIPPTCSFSHHLSSFDLSIASCILPEHPSDPSFTSQSRAWSPLCKGMHAHCGK